MNPGEISKELHDFVAFNRDGLDKIKAGQPDVYAAVVNVLAAIDKKYCDGNAIPIGINALLKAGAKEPDKKLPVEEGQLFVNTAGTKFLMKEVLTTSALSFRILLPSTAMASVLVTDSGKSTRASTGETITFPLPRIENWIKTGEWKLESQFYTPDGSGMVVGTWYRNLKHPGSYFKYIREDNTFIGPGYTLDGTYKINGKWGKKDGYAMASKAEVDLLEAGTWPGNNATPAAPVPSSSDPTNDIVGKTLKNPVGTYLTVTKKTRVNKKSISYTTRNVSTGKPGTIKMGLGFIKSMLGGETVKGWRLDNIMAGANDPPAPKTTPVKAMSASTANDVKIKRSNWTSDWRKSGYRPSVQRSASAASMGEVGMGFNGFVYRVAADANGTQRWTKISVPPMAAVREFSKLDLGVLYDQYASGLTSFDPSDDEYKELQDNLKKLEQLMK